MASTIAGDIKTSVSCDPSQFITGLGTAAGAADNFSRKITATKGSFSLFNKSMYASAAMMYTISRAISNMSRGMEEYTNVLAKLGTVADLTTSSIQALADSMKNLSLVHATSRKDIMEAMYVSAQAGFTAPAQMRAMAGSASALSRASGKEISVKQSADLMSVLRNTFGFSNKTFSSGYLTDMLLRSRDLGRWELNQMVPAIGSAAPVWGQQFSKRLGPEEAYRQLLTFASSMTQAGMNPRETATSIRRIVERSLMMSNNSSGNVLSRNLNANGFPKKGPKDNSNILDALNAKEGPIGFIKTLYNITGGETSELIKNGYLSRDVRGVAALMQGGGARTFDMYRQLGGINAGGTTNKYLNKMKNTYSYSRDRLRSEWELTSQEFMRSSIPLIQDLTSVLSKMNEVARALPDSVKSLMMLVAAFSAIRAGSRFIFGTNRKVASAAATIANGAKGEKLAAAKAVLNGGTVGARQVAVDEAQLSASNRVRLWLRTAYDKGVAAREERIEDARAMASAPLGPSLQGTSQAASVAAPTISIMPVVPSVLRTGFFERPSIIKPQTQAASFISKERGILYNRRIPFAPKSVEMLRAMRAAESLPYSAGSLPYNAINNAYYGAGEFPVPLNRANVASRLAGGGYIGSYTPLDWKYERLTGNSPMAAPIPFNRSALSGRIAGGAQHIPGISERFPVLPYRAHNRLGRRSIALPYVSQDALQAVNAGIPYVSNLPSPVPLHKPPARPVLPTLKNLNVVNTSGKSQFIPNVTGVTAGEAQLNLSRPAPIPVARDASGRLLVGAKQISGAAAPTTALPKKHGPIWLRSELGLAPLSSPIGQIAPIPAGTATPSQRSFASRLGIGDLTAKMSGLRETLGKVTAGVGGVASAMGGLVSSMTAAYGPMILMTGAIAAVSSAVKAFNDSRTVINDKEGGFEIKKAVKLSNASGTGSFLSRGWKNLWRRIGAIGDRGDLDTAAKIEDEENLQQNLIDTNQYGYAFRNDNGTRNWRKIGRALAKAVGVGGTAAAAGAGVGSAVPGIGTAIGASVFGLTGTAASLGKSIQDSRLRPVTMNDLLLKAYQEELTPENKKILSAMGYKPEFDNKWQRMLTEKFRSNYNLDYSKTPVESWTQGNNGEALKTYGMLTDVIKELIGSFGELQLTVQKQVEQEKGKTNTLKLGNELAGLSGNSAFFNFSKKGSGIISKDNPMFMASDLIRFGMAGDTNVLLSDMRKNMLGINPLDYEHTMGYRPDATRQNAMRTAVGRMRTDLAGDYSVEKTGMTGENFGKALAFMKDKGMGDTSKIETLYNNYSKFSNIRRGENLGWSQLAKGGRLNGAAIMKSILTSEQFKALNPKQRSDISAMISAQDPTQFFRVQESTAALNSNALAYGSQEGYNKSIERTPEAVLIGIRENLSQLLESVVSYAAKASELSKTADAINESIYTYLDTRLKTEMTDAVYDGSSTGIAAGIASMDLSGGWASTAVDE